MADLKVTVGADLSELEKGVKSSGKTLADGIEGSSGGLNINKGFTALAGGGLGSLATYIAGAIFGPIGELASELIQKSKEILDYAVKLRSISLATGMSYSQLQELNMVSAATGVSIDTMAKGIADFNKKMGETSMRGGEMMPVLARLGVGLNEVKDGSFGYWDAVKKLSESYEAGTDAVTLAYYGNQLLGASYEEMLPLIKMGSRAIDDYRNSVYKANDDSVKSMAMMSDTWNVFWESFKNVMFEVLGDIMSALIDTYLAIKGADAILEAAFGDEAEAAKKLVSVQPTLLSREERIAQAERVAGALDEKSAKKFMDAFMEELDKGAKNGKKLTLPNLMEAKGASQMQQMGGGDIFGAVAFSPLQNIEKNTERAADSLDKMASKQPESQSRETSPSIFQGPPL